MAAASPNDIPQKRPFYLFLALSAAWIFGVNGAFGGCSSISYYRGDAPDTDMLIPDFLEKDEDREAVRSLGAQLLKVRGEAQNRVFPLAVASLLLGWTMVILAARAMGGRGSVRPVLIQVVCAQTAFIVIEHLLTSDLRLAEGAFEIGRSAIEFERAQPGSFWGGYLTRHPHFFERVMPYQLGFRVLIHGFIVWALMRRRSIAFFEATGGPVSET